MRFRSCTRAGLAGVLALAIVAVAALPAVAFASVAGDSGDTAITLAVPSHVTGTLVTDPDPDFNDAVLWYTVHMTAGQTLAATITADPSVAWTGLESFAALGFGGECFSDYVSDNVGRLRLMAPSTGDYFVIAEADAPAPFSIDATIVPAVPFSLSSVTAPKTAKKNKSFGVACSVAPVYDGLASPIRFYAQRKSGSTWKAYKNVAGGLADDSSATRTPFKASFKLPKGTYRVRARFVDAAHKTAKYSGWKSVKVK